MVSRLLVLVLVVACRSERPPASDRPAAPGAGLRWPTIVDSHVHVSYWPIADRLARTGIGAVVDLAAPEPALATAAAPGAPRVIAAGPMLTRPDGYPLDSWGADGYGIGCGDAACVTATIDRLARAGARVIKLALGNDGLAPPLVPIAVAHAHARALVVAVHALDDASVKLAGEAGADLLAHTPVEPLSDASVRLWRGKAVISTLAAFGAPAAPANLRRLRAAGCTVLYGTDLGNLRDAGPSVREIALLREAGLDDRAIVEAMTTTPTAFWGLANDASFLVVERDPRTDVGVLLRPREVWLGGRRVR